MLRKPMENPGFKAMYDKISPRHQRVIDWLVSRANNEGACMFKWPQFKHAFGITTFSGARVLMDYLKRKKMIKHMNEGGVQYVTFQNPYKL